MSAEHATIIHEEAFDECDQQASEVMHRFHQRFVQAVREAGFTITDDHLAHFLENRRYYHRAIRDRRSITIESTYRGWITCVSPTRWGDGLTIGYQVPNRGIWEAFNCTSFVYAVRRLDKEIKQHDKAQKAAVQLLVQNAPA